MNQTYASSYSAVPNNSNYIFSYKFITGLILAATRENLSSGFPTTSNTNQVCTITEGGKRLEILFVGRKGLVLVM